jgi:uncharacterized NAD-dependent epimerase/dehydratase family protein
VHPRRHARPVPRRRARTRSSSATSRAARGSRGCPTTDPPLAQLVELHERTALPIRPCRVAAIAPNTRTRDEPAARRAIADTGGGDGTLADDPIRFSAAHRGWVLATWLSPCGG